MSSDNENQDSDFADAARFRTTHWSIVLAAARRWSPDSSEALAALCGTYWYPLYAYARRRVGQADLAQDLTQEFFATLLEKNYLAAAEQKRGRFRRFLLTAFKHFLAKERDRARAQKRGGGRAMIPLDFERGESRYRLEPADALTPERLYDRRWALTMLEEVLRRLQDEWAAAGKTRLFERLKDSLTGGRSSQPYAQLAEELAMTEGAVKVAVYRLRRRYRDLLREEIAQTVSGPEELEDELRHLFAAVRSEKG